MAPEFSMSFNFSDILLKPNQQLCSHRIHQGHPLKENLFIFNNMNLFIFNNIKERLKVNYNIQLIVRKIQPF